jgi:poly(beta-D-mannuronate) lyase
MLSFNCRFKVFYFLLLFNSIYINVIALQSVFSLNFTLPRDWLAWHCPPCPPPPAKLTANSFYSDANHSIVDPSLFSLWLSNSKPFNDFVEFVANMVDARRPVARDCALTWLSTWARRRAMLDTASPEINQHHMLRAWSTTGLAMSVWRMIKLCSPHDMMRPDVQVIVRWLVQCISRSMTPFNRPHALANNHAQAIGLSCLIVGVLADDVPLIAFARRQFDAAMSRIRNGTLPLELQRASRAAHYHAFALQHIMLAAEVAKVALHEDWAVARGGDRFRQLVSFTLGGLRDPRSLAHVVKSSEFETPEGPVRAVAAFALRRPWGSAELPAGANVETILSDTYKLSQRSNCFDPRSGGNLCEMARNGFAACAAQ